MENDNIITNLEATCPNCGKEMLVELPDNTCLYGKAEEIEEFNSLRQIIGEIYSNTQQEMKKSNIFNRKRRNKNILYFMQEHIDGYAIKIHQLREK